MRAAQRVPLPRRCGPARICRPLPGCAQSAQRRLDRARAPRASRRLQAQHRTTGSPSYSRRPSSTSRAARCRPPAETCAAPRRQTWCNSSRVRAATATPMGCGASTQSHNGGRTSPDGMGEAARLAEAAHVGTPPPRSPAVSGDRGPATSTDESQHTRPRGTHSPEPNATDLVRNEGFGPIVDEAMSGLDAQALTSMCGSFPTQRGHASEGGSPSCNDAGESSPGGASQDSWGHDNMQDLGKGMQDAAMSSFHRKRKLAAEKSAAEAAAIRAAEEAGGYAQS